VGEDVSIPYARLSVGEDVSIPYARLSVGEESQVKQMHFSNTQKLISVGS